MATKNRLMRQPAKVGDNTQSTYRVVPDADAVYATARAAGALIVLEILHGNGRLPLGAAVCVRRVAGWSPPSAAFLRQQSGVSEPYVEASAGREHEATVCARALASIGLRRGCAPGRTGLEMLSATAVLNRRLPGMRQQMFAGCCGDESRLSY